jgi:hypothetical protein
LQKDFSFTKHQVLNKRIREQEGSNEGYEYDDFTGVEEGLDGVALQGTPRRGNLLPFGRSP